MDTTTKLCLGGYLIVMSTLVLPIEYAVGWNLIPGFHHELTALLLLLVVIFGGALAYDGIIERFREEAAAKQKKEV